MGEVTNEWIESEICHHEKMAAILAANGRAEHSEEHDSYADVLCELLTRRAADEGAVTVEGFVAPAVFTLRPEDHYTQLEVLENSDEWSAQPVTVKIWRRP